MRKPVTKAMRQLVSSWYELLNVCGGELETDKCAWYKISSVFRKNKT